MYARGFHTINSRNCFVIFRWKARLTIWRCGVVHRYDTLYLSKNFKITVFVDSVLVDRKFTVIHSLTFLTTYNLHQHNNVTNKMSRLLDLNNQVTHDWHDSLVTEDVYHLALHIAFANQKDSSVAQSNTEQRCYNFKCAVFISFYNFNNFMISQM